MNLTGKARLAGVAGWPIAHSLSPRLHGFWLAQYGIDGAFVPLAIRREDFAVAVNGLRRAGFAGMNVTLPHKEAAFAISHVLDSRALAAGAVNLLLFHEDGRIEGRNTDATGLAAHLADGLGEDALRGASAVLLGSGGAARAGVIALDALGVAEIRILARNAAKAQTMAASLAPFVAAKLSVQEWAAWPAAAAGAALLLNTTSAGMKGAAALDLPLEPLPAGAAVCDIVYNPLETDLLKRARARGHVTVDGLGMLMHQAVPAFEAFFGVKPQVTPALRAYLEEALT